MHTHTIDVIIERFYHLSLQSWIKNTCALEETHSMTEIASRVKSDFDHEFQTLFKGKTTPGVKSIEDAWSYWIRGIWGICLQDVSVKSMAQKELSRLAVKQITANNTKQNLNCDEKKLLQQAIAVYNEAAIDEFVPFMQSTCSRTTEINAAKEKYL